MITPAQNLRAAATYLEKHGWAQKAYKRDDGAVCVGRALNLTGSSAAAFTALWKFIGCESEWGHQRWNDHDDRTFGEVKAALLGAAEVLERENPEWPR